MMVWKMTFQKPNTWFSSSMLIFQGVHLYVASRFFSHSKNRQPVRHGSRNSTSQSTTQVAEVFWNPPKPIQERNREENGTLFLEMCALFSLKRNHNLPTLPPSWFLLKMGPWFSLWGVRFPLNHDAWKKSSQPQVKSPAVATATWAFNAACSEGVGAATYQQHHCHHRLDRIFRRIILFQPL